MVKFNPVEWVIAQSRIKYEDNFLIEGIPFQLMSLSEENIVAARLLATSQEIIKLAASGGFAIDRKRTIESADENLVNSVELLWQHEEILAFDDPTIMFSVGEKVCELSGLSDVLAELILDEEEAERLAKIEQAHEEALYDESKIVEGDALDMDKVEADANEYLNNQNVA
jgi:hypothetical protein